MCEETKRTHPKLEEHTVDELIQIILRKDEVERRSNNTIKELNSKLEESEKTRCQIDTELYAIKAKCENDLFFLKMEKLKVKRYRKQCFWYKIVISLLVILSLGLTYVVLINY